MQQSRAPVSTTDRGRHDEVLLLLNDAPYGVERTCNALQTAGVLAKREGVVLKLFLLVDAAAAAKSVQKVSAGYYNTEVMLAGPLPPNITCRLRRCGIRRTRRSAPAYRNCARCCV